MLARLVVVIACFAGCDRLYSATSHDRDAAVSDAPSGGPGCSPMSLLVGDFAQGATFQTPWWNGATTGPAAFSSATSDTIDVKFPLATSKGTADIAANAFFDLRDTSFSIAVTLSATSYEGDVTLTLLDLTRTSSLQITIGGPMISFVLVDHGVRSVLVAEKYSPLTDRHWRIANHGTTTTWETSADGSTYQVRAMAMSLPWVTYLRPALSLDRPSSTSALTATFDQVNTGTSVGAGCPIAQLADDFNRATLGDQWYTRVSSGGSVTPDGTSVTMALDGSAPSGVSALVSSKLYDLRNANLVFELLNPTATTSTYARFGAFATTGDSASFMQTPSSFSAMHGDTALIVLPGTPPPWWRLREADGTVYYETSSDGMGWDPKGSASLDGSDRAQVVLGLYQTAAAGASMVRFDNVNAPP